MQRKALDGCSGAIFRASSLFRLGMEGDANDTLVEIIDGISEILADSDLPEFQAITNAVV